MVNQDLVEFIKKGLEKGYSDSQIRTILLDKNWPIEYIDEAFNQIKPTKKLSYDEVDRRIEPIMKPKKHKSDLAKKIILNILAIIVIVIFLVCFFKFNMVKNDLKTCNETVTQGSIILLGQEVAKGSECDFGKFILNMLKAAMIASGIVFIFILFHYIRKKVS